MLPLLALTKFLSKHFTQEECQFAGELAFKLSGRISARREIAGGGGEELGMNINPKLQMGVSIGSTLSKGAISTAVKCIASSIGTAMIIEGTVASMGIAVGVGLVISGGVYVLETRAKNRIKGKADIYKNYFPSDPKVIKLLSQLVTLSMHKELQVTALQAEEKQSPWQSIKNGLKNVVRVITAEKVAPTKEQAKIKTWVESEFNEIWDIFKNFTRHQKDYDAFKEASLAKKIIGLFESHFDLGDPNDRSEIVNELEINRLWINLFACYLAGKDLEVQALTLRVLESKLNAFEVNQNSLAQPPIATKKVQAMRPLFERDRNDALLSFRNRPDFSPQLFSKKASGSRFHSHVDQLDGRLRPLETSQLR